MSSQTACVPAEAGPPQGARGGGGGQEQVAGDAAAAAPGPDPLPATWLAASHEIAMLHPGFTLIKAALSERAQLDLAAIAFERGEGPKGWYLPVDDASTITATTTTTTVPGNEPGGTPAPATQRACADGNTGDRGGSGDVVGPSTACPSTPRAFNVPKKKAGKVYDTLDSFPSGPQLSALAIALLRLASTVDPCLAKVPVAPPTHLLLWNYRPSKGGRIGWHRDNWQGDGDADYPVISLSVGATCNFGWRPEPSEGNGKDNRSLQLASGDVVIFGGPSRMMEHAVKSVHTEASAPPVLQHPHPLSGGRLNFTFRHAPLDGELNVHLNTVQ